MRLYFTVKIRAGFLRKFGNMNNNKCSVKVDNSTKNKNNKLLVVSNANKMYISKEYS